MTSLHQRFLSAVILAPLVLACIVLGGGLFLGLVIGALFLALREWIRLASSLERGLICAGLGSLYIALCMAAFAYMRLGFSDGLYLTLAFLLSVWASDTGAYIAGKTIGGPKMAPAISPNKTWAGLAGAVAGAATVLWLGFTLFAGYFGADDLPLWDGPYAHALVLVTGALAGICGQAGDLLISFVKRRAGVKDTGRLIPGHGGLLDRIDALMLASLVVTTAIWALQAVGGA